MKYINANAILLDALVEELQKYVQAGYIYVPAKDEQHKAWGELSGYREELDCQAIDIIGACAYNNSRRGRSPKK